MSLELLKEKIINWGENRNFYCEINGTNPSKQMLKLFEELGELSGNLAKGRCVKDDLGDIFVVLCGIAKLTNNDLTECVKLAYDEIKDRKGKMIDGVFVKESDLNGN